MEYLENITLKEGDIVEVKKDGSDNIHKGRIESICGLLFFIQKGKQKRGFALKDSRSYKFRKIQE